MVLYTNGGDKVNCTKCGMPKLSSRKVWYTSINGKIGSKHVKFFYNVTNSASRLYFRDNEQWYCFGMVNKDGMDIFNYIESGNVLYTNLSDYLRNILMKRKLIKESEEKEG